MTWCCILSGGNLDVLVPSESVCGRDKTKTVSSTILFHCSPAAGEGIPEFLLETDGCQYLFVWHTATVCKLLWVLLKPNHTFKLQHRFVSWVSLSIIHWFSRRSSTSVDPHSSDGGEEHAGLSGRSQALGAVLSLLLVVLTICLLVLLLHKRDRR